MKPSPIEVEQVVREVLAELQRASAEGAGCVARPERSDGRGGRAITPAAAHSDAPPTAASAVAENELVVSARLVTMSELDGRLAAVRRLVVPPQAVVTPAVRDELLRRNISLAYGATRRQNAAGMLRLAVVAVGRRFEPAPLATALGSKGVEAQVDTLDCLIAATDQLAAGLSAPHTVGLLLTRHTAAALCLANRHQGVRAVLGGDAVTAAAATEAVGANLLIVDPAAVNFVQLKRMAIEFCRGEARACPEVFCKRLA